MVHDWDVIAFTVARIARLVHRGNGADECLALICKLSSLMNPHLS